MASEDEPEWNSCRQIASGSGEFWPCSCASLWWLRRKGIAATGLARRRRGGRGVWSALERLPLGPQHTLHLVRWARRRYCCASSPSGCALVDREPFRETGATGGLHEDRAVADRLLLPRSPAAGAADNEPFSFSASSPEDGAGAQRADADRRSC